MPSTRSHPKASDAFTLLSKCVLRLFFCLLLFCGRSFAQNVVYLQQLYSNSSFSSYQIDTNGIAVGSINGSHGVSPTGAGTYTIPIAVPPGTQGVIPSIQISYSSQGGNGPLGIGWGISGLSAITRTGSDNFHEHAPTAVSFNSDDRFVIDGTRLVGTSGTYGAVGATYSTESQNFGVVTSYGTNGSGPEWFQVVKKDGTIMEYGKTTDSKFSAGTHGILIWHLDKIQDIHGNYITFSYTPNNGETLIDEISYTGNDAVPPPTGPLAPYNKIKFLYSLRSDKNTAYDAGYAINSNSLLTNIQVTGDGGATFKTYNFSYGFDNVRSYLQEVEEQGAFGGKLNKTIFKYGENQLGKMDISTTGISSSINFNFLSQQAFYNRNMPYAGDFNGDGISDILVSQEDGQQACCGIGHSAGFGIYLTNAPACIPSPAYSTIFTSTTIVNNSHNSALENYYISDFNGDRLDDIITITTDGGNQIDHLTIYYSNYSNCNYSINTGINQATTLQPPSLPYYNGTHYKQINHEDRTMRIGDFDGDGMTDYILYVGDGNNNWMWFISFPGKGIWNQPLYLYGFSNSYFKSYLDMTDQIRVLDFDGDGKSDIMLTIDVNAVSTNHTEIYNIRYDNNTTAWYLKDRLYGSNYPSSKHQVYIGDFNGDGKADLFTLDPNNSYSPEVDLSTGTGFVNPSNFSLNSSFRGELPCTWCTCSSWLCGWMLGCDNHSQHYPGDEIYIGDFDGDGKSDILQYHPTITDCQNMQFSSYFDVYYSKGTSFQRQNYTWNSAPSNTSLGEAELFPMRMIADMNGDGKSDLTAPTTLNANIQTIYFDALSNTYGNEKVIEKIEDGMGRVTQFDYKPLTQGVHTQGAISDYPLNSVQPPLPVVATVTEPTDNGSPNTITYSYTDAKLHNCGRGFLGFQSVDAYNSALNTQIHSEYTIDPIYYVPWLSKAITYVGPNVTSEVENHMIFSGSNGTFTQQLHDLVEHNLAGATNTTNYAYDTNGNITQTIVDINGAENTTTNTNYFIGSSSVSNVYYSKPQSVSATTTRTGQSPVSVTHTYTYNSADLLSKDVFVAGYQGLATTKDYLYDVFGNVTSGTVTGYANTQSTVSSVYDTKGRFQESTTNPMGQTVTAVFDRLWGKPKSETDLAGNTTTYEYDEWGRLVKTVLPFYQNYPIVNIYRWDLNTSATPITYSNTVTLNPGHSDLRVWYNQTGKEVKKQTDGYNGVVTTTKEYDNAGNLSMETEPYLPTEIPPRQTTYAYDNVYKQRLSSSTNFQGTTNYSYIYGSGNTIVQTSGPNVPCPANGTASKTSDATGKIISATDGGGTLNFVYDSWGNKLTTEHTGGSYSMIIQTNAYDVGGRLSSTTDYNGNYVTPRVSNYYYDDNNHLIKEIDANGNIVTYTYDLLDHITDRNGPEGLTHYDYYPILPGIGGYPNKLKDVIDFNHHVETYTYNLDGSLNKKVKTVNGNIANTLNSVSYDYDQYGRLTANKGPWTEVGYAYDTHGNLDRVYDNSFPNTIYYQNQTQNGLGEPTQYSLGNGLTTTNTYNNGLPTNYSTPGIQNLDMQWVNAGLNLTQRTDNRKHTTDYFGYDILFRLNDTWSTYLDINNHTVINPLTSSSYDNHSGASRGNHEKEDAAAITNNNFNYYMYQLSSVRNPSAFMSTTQQNPQNIVYTGFRQPASIVEGNNEIDFSYDADYQRKTSTLLQNGQPTEIREYYGDWERIHNVAANTDYIVNYISGGDGICAMSVLDISSCNFNGNIYNVQVSSTRSSGTYVTVNNCTVTPVVYYLYKDHLGSFLTITDKFGTIAGEQNFDAWGRMRNPVEWNYNNTNTNYVPMPSWMIRGYTGQEHLQQFGLINLNARLYDPLVGRMLGPDKYIPNSFYTQDYNAYTYARNNPLKYTDKDGEWVQYVIGAVVGAVEGWQIGQKQGAKGWSMFGDIVAGAAIGAASAGAATMTASAGAFEAGTVAGAVGGAGFSIMTNSPVFMGAISGGLSGGIGGFAGAAVGGGLGAFVGGATGSGINAALNNGNLEDIGVSALSGGVMAFGIYHASSYLGWEFAGGKKWGNVDISYRQYCVMQADFQRSRVWRQEYGGALMDDGSVQRFDPSTRANYKINGAHLPPGAKGWYHTHWDEAGKTITVDVKGNHINKAQYQQTHSPGNQIAVHETTTEKGLSPEDFTNTGWKSIVIDRHNAYYWSGQGTSMSTFSPPINRFVWSFYFWRR